jgi:hypothetical protein
MARGRRKRNPRAIARNARSAGRRGPPIQSPNPTTRKMPTRSLMLRKRMREEVAAIRRDGQKSKIPRSRT